MVGVVHPVVGVVQAQVPAPDQVQVAAWQRVEGAGRMGVPHQLHHQVQTVAGLVAAGAEAEHLEYLECLQA